MSNLELWDKVRRVPKEALKGFKRSGGFEGTAIKPMWSFHKMTEEFGPCGIGWGIGEPTFQVVPATEGEVLVYCTASVWHKDRNNVVYGVGGDKAVGKNKYGLNPDDEAFKKAFTDAITNALKLLGVGADIHMGLWDGNKYVDETPADKPTTTPKAVARPEYKKISDGIRQIKETGTTEDLRAWYKSHSNSMKSWDADWLDKIVAEFDEASASLKAKAA